MGAARALRSSNTLRCRHRSCPATLSLPRLRPGHPGKTQGGRAPLPRSHAGLSAAGKHRGGSPSWGPRGREGAAGRHGRQRLQMGTCRCMSASRAPAPGSPCWRLRGFSVLCPSPPHTACCIQGLCKCRPCTPPPTSSDAPAGLGQREPRRLCSPSPRPGERSVTQRPALHLRHMPCSPIPTKRHCLVAGQTMLLLSQTHVLTLGETAAVAGHFHFAPEHPYMPTQ